MSFNISSPERGKDFKNSLKSDSSGPIINEFVFQLIEFRDEPFYFDKSDLAASDYKIKGLLSFTLNENKEWVVVDCDDPLNEHGNPTLRNRDFN